jgi:hypothetical protein
VRDIRNSELSGSARLIGAEEIKPDRSQGVGGKRITGDVGECRFDRSHRGFVCSVDVTEEARETSFACSPISRDNEPRDRPVKQLGPTRVQ